MATAAWHKSKASQPFPKACPSLIKQGRNDMKSTTQNINAIKLKASKGDIMQAKNCYCLRALTTQRSGLLESSGDTAVPAETQPATLPPTRLPSPIPSQAQKTFPVTWPSQAIRLPRQLAFPGNSPSQAVGLPRQFAFPGSWPSQAVGLPRQFAFPGSWPSQAIRLPRQLAFPAN